MHSIKSKLVHYINRFNFSGLIVALIFFCFSMLPSLLPRPAIYQSIISGISLAIGYGIGVFFSVLVRWLIQKEIMSKEHKNIAWRVLAIIGGLVAVVFVFMGGRWQDEVRQLVGEQPKGDSQAMLIALSAMIVFVILLSLSRSLRRVTRWVNTQIAKFLPHRVSVALGVSAIILIFVWLVSGVLLNFFVTTANSIYDNKNNTTPPGVSQPLSFYKSGSPESLVPWDTLGYQGQAFTGRGPSQQQLTDYYKGKTKEPIRVYAGINSADSPQARANLALQELKRTDAFSRQVLVLATATGTGWLEPQSVDSIEYMYGGDTAIVTQQYSYLPSWISFLVDKQNAENAGLALYDAVYAEWSKLPTDKRPKLIAYGLSLGSFGGQTPYAGIGDITASIDGALFMGTPNDTQLWRTVTNSRDTNSPEILPIYQNGISARFAASNEEITANQSSWQYPRILFMQHASDPVVWFSFDLILNEPDWLKEPRGSDVSTLTRWFPFVTFFQVTIDQFFGTTVPNGHGHNYPNTIVNAWAAVTNPPNWNVDKQSSLQAIIDTYSNE